MHYGAKCLCLQQTDSAVNQMKALTCLLHSSCPRLTGGAQTSSHVSALGTWNYLYHIAVAAHVLELSTCHCHPLHKITSGDSLIINIPPCSLLPEAHLTAVVTGLLGLTAAPGGLGGERTGINHPSWLDIPFPP